MIYYGTPYSVQKCLGRAYNEFMALLPQSTDFGCLIDADAMFTTPDYGHQLAEIVAENPACRLFYGTTNRIACPWQRDLTVMGDDLRLHREHGLQVSKLKRSIVREVQTLKPAGSGFLILLRKDLWGEIPFHETGMLNVDWEFFSRAVKRGETILQMMGVYLYHWYRGGNGADTRHLR